MTPEFESKFLYPKYWITWVVLGFWRLIIFLPYPVLVGIGYLLGQLLYILPSSRKKIAQTNIKLCFPNLTEIQRKRLLHKNCASLGIAVIETGIAWWWSNERLSRIMQYEGLENLKSLESSGGIILLGIHYTTLEIGASAIMMKTQLDGMYREHKNDVFNYVQLKGRASRNPDCYLYERRDVRSTMKALKNGRMVWYGPDQDYGLSQGVFAPFFNIQAATVTGTARFARISGSSVIPFSHIRMPKARGYKVKVYPKLENFPSEKLVDDTIRVNQEIERLILIKPDQYLWAHRRFKNRPEGEDKLYN